MCKQERGVIFDKILEQSLKAETPPRKRNPPQERNASSFPSVNDTTLIMEAVIRELTLSKSLFRESDVVNKVSSFSFFLNSSKKSCTSCLTHSFEGVSLCEPCLKQAQAKTFFIFFLKLNIDIYYAVLIVIRLNRVLNTPIITAILWLKTHFKKAMH